MVFITEQISQNIFLSLRSCLKSWASLQKYCYYHKISVNPFENKQSKLPIWNTAHRRGARLSSEWAMIALNALSIWMSSQSMFSQTHHFLKTFIITEIKIHFTGFFYTMGEQKQGCIRIIVFNLCYSWCWASKHFKWGIFRLDVKNFFHVSHCCKK